MEWARKHKVVLSAMFTLLFTAFSLGHPFLFHENLYGKNSDSGTTKICTSSFYIGGQTIHSERLLAYHLFVKKQQLDKFIVKQPYLTAVICNLNCRTIQQFPQSTSYTVLDRNCILRI